MKPSILFVDDDPNILSSFSRQLRKRYEVDTASGGQEGLDLVGSGRSYSVVVSDMQMPGMNGVEFLSKLSMIAPDTERMMLTGNADRQTAVDAVNKGHVRQFMTKPCPIEELAIAIGNSVRQYEMIQVEKTLLQDTLNGSINVLTDILSQVDSSAFGQSKKQNEMMQAISACFPEEEKWELELAATLSRIGNVTLPASLRMKLRHGERLTGEENDIVKRLPEIGSHLLDSIPRLENVAATILYQDKDYDGEGYPTDSVSGNDIPIGARILRVVKDFIAHQAKGCTAWEAFRKLEDEEGVYDSEILSKIIGRLEIISNKPEEKAISISLSSLQVGQVLASDVTNVEGLKIISSGTTVTKFIMEKIKNFSQVSNISEPIFVKQ